MKTTPRLLLLASLLLACEGQIPVGNHTPQLQIGAMTVGVRQGEVSVVGGVPVTVQVRRGPKPWGMNLTARVHTGEGLEVDVREGDVVPIDGKPWKVLAITAYLREGALIDPEVALVLNPI